MDDSPTFYVRRQGRVEGPWPLDKLQSEVKLRKLGRHHEVSEDGDSWRRASHVEGLFQKLKRRGVATPQAESSGEYQLRPENNGSDGKVWYCYQNDEQEGPMTLSNLSQMINRGQILLDDLIYRDGYEDWIPAEEVPELAAALNVTNSQDDGGETAATRLVERPVTVVQSKLAVASAITAIILLVPSCLPFVGFLGLVPVAMSGFAIVQLRKTKGRGIGYAYAGLALGAFQVVLALILLVFGVVGLITHWMNNP